MDVGPVIDIAEISKSEGRLVASAIRSARIKGVVHPVGDLVLAASGVIFQNDGTEEQGDSRGGGHRRCHGELVEIGADDIELPLVEREAVTMGQVGGVDVDVWARSCCEIFERGLVENFLIIVVEGEEAAAEGGGDQPQEIPGPESSEEQGPLNVLVEKFLLEILEDAVSVEAVIGCRKSAAGNGTNGVDLVQKSNASAVDGDLGIPQFFENAVCERRRAGASTRKSYGEPDVSEIDWLGCGEAAVASARVDIFEWLVDGLKSSAAAKCYGHPHDEGSTGGG